MAKIDIIKYSNGLGVPIGVRAAGWMFIVVGIYLSFIESTWFLIMSFAGLTVEFNKTGSILDIQNQRYIDYSYLWFIRIGKWRGIKNYTKLTLIQSATGSKVTPNSFGVSTTTTSYFYDIHLVRRDLKYQRFLARYKSRTLAKNEIKSLCENFGFEEVKLKSKYL